MTVGTGHRGDAGRAAEVDLAGSGPGRGSAAAVARCECLGGCFAGCHRRVRSAAACPADGLGVVLRGEAEPSREVRSRARTDCSRSDSSV